MQLRYDEDLVEAGVFICASRPNGGISPLQVARFHRERERLYAILDPDARNAAFFKLHLEWFREWGLESALSALLDEFPVPRRELEVLAFRKARGRHEEGAELYVQADAGPCAVAALCAERFARPTELTAFLRHEFMHLADMLDDAFGYSPEVFVPGGNAAPERLTRERYRLLWDITIDGRLTRSQRATVGNRDLHRRLFDRAFGFWPDHRRDAVFASLWNGDGPRHHELLAMAADPRGLRDAQSPLPGAPCPLCGFPAFDWVIGPSIGPEIARAVSAEFPHWTPAHGLCRRCHEIYETRCLPKSIAYATDFGRASSSGGGAGV